MENNKLKRGRPTKKDYDPEKQMQELLDTATVIYEETHELKKTAVELSMPPHKIKKLLITAGVIEYPETKQIMELREKGKSFSDIQDIMGMGYSTLHTYLPYSKVIYNMSEISQNAERVKRYQERKKVLREFQDDMTEQNLWKCIVAFQEYPFFTMTGLPFSYTLKIGKNGSYNRELLIDRRKESKSLAWSSVVLAFRSALEKRDTVITKPKMIADVRGISYTASLLCRFGVITVSPKG